MDLNTLSITSIMIGIISFIIILVDVSRNPQKMNVMNAVWPVTGLYAGPLAMIAYFMIGKNAARKKTPIKNGENDVQDGDMYIEYQQKKPFWQSVMVGALHCGSGCTLGDVIAEGFLLFFPVTLFGSTLFGGWAIDFVFAFFIGIVFQYFAIQPMKKLSFKKALIAALKADTLSLFCWQIGMYGWMAISIFWIYHHRLDESQPLFWFMMQIAMLLGFITAYPINWWLIKKGIKEVM